MEYSVKISKKFWNSAKKLKYKYTNEQFSEIIDEIKESIRILINEGQLPKGYHDHVLKRSPYTNFNEYHVYDDDVLVVYNRQDKKLYLRFIEVIDHETLNQKSNDENL